MAATLSAHMSTVASMAEAVDVHNLDSAAPLCVLMREVGKM